MRCAVCHSELEYQELQASDRACPACGRGARAADEFAEPRVVEGSIEPSESGQMAYMPARQPASDGGTPRALVPSAPTHPALAALSRLPALAWQQPIVRSAVKTGAGAVALTVALRLAGRFVMSRGARQVARESLLPTLADLLQQGENGQPITRRSGHGEISETFVYIRRTVRL